MWHHDLPVLNCCRSCVSKLYLPKSLLQMLWAKKNWSEMELRSAGLYKRPWLWFFCMFHMKMVWVDLLNFFSRLEGFSLYCLPSYSSDFKYQCFRKPLIVLYAIHVWHLTEDAIFPLNIWWRPLFEQIQWHLWWTLL